jgi:hypothetical protein
MPKSTTNEPQWTRISGVATLPYSLSATIRWALVVSPDESAPPGFIRVDACPFVVQLHGSDLGQHFNLPNAGPGTHVSFPDAAHVVIACQSLSKKMKTHNSLDI